VLQGVGLHSGTSVSVELGPNVREDGVWFERSDLPGKPRIRATVDQVVETQRCTALGSGEVRVYTVEHLLAALHAAQIDHCTIAVSGPELPAAGGSSLPYVELIREAGILELASTVKPCYLTDPLFVSDGDAHLVALPSDIFRVSYTLHYPNCQVIRSQYSTFAVEFESFAREIAPARTYGHFREIEVLKQAGLIRGGSLDCAVVIGETAVLNEEGLRFPDEMVRHKILDLIGDLMLVGRPFTAHVIAICSGHRSNCRLADKLMKHFTME
jgi:UDP-3-O-[3-hydroxymyristoyl] N-acetylglucosamine deacetylase